MRGTLVYLGLSLLAIPALAYPHYRNGWKAREIVEDDAASEYDYVIVGGGQSALVIANRLSEESSSVLVVEYGYLADDAQLEPSSAKVWLPEYMYNLTSAPQPGIGNKSVTIWSAAVVGGGSAINGMMLNRGSADEYNNWAKLGNPGWSFEDLLPYFIKSTKFQRPSPQLEEEFGITWNESVYGADGPIHNSFAPFQWPGIKHQWQGFVESGAEPQIDGGDGKAYGVYWYKSAVDNTTVTRSYARTGYYDPIQDRENLHLLTGWRVNEVLFNTDKHATGITMQPRTGNNSSEATFVRAKKEVIICAGALHSPIVLQRSGIGPTRLLEEAGIDVVVDLPGVGSNLQDHPTLSISYSYTKNVWPNPTESLDNATFVEWAEQAWEQNRTGPYSQTVGNAAAYLPLRLIASSSPDDDDDDSWRSIHDTYLAQEADTYLPSHYTPSQILGYEAQRTLLADSMTRDDNAALEFTFNAGSTFPLILNKPLSRGTVLLDPKNLDVVVDFHALHNPLDATIFSESLRYARRFHDTPTMKRVFAPRELTPGSDVIGDAELETYVRANAGATAAHLSGTCAMMPRDLGGVVAADLTVYGVTGLSVGDASIMPLIPGAHTCASVYAVAEKAADLIKARHQQ